MLKMRCLILIIITMLCSVSLFSQTAPGKSGKPRFSSVYTDLKRDCKWDKEAAEAKTCKGYGGYSVSIGYPAMSEQLGIETKDGDFIPVYPPNARIPYLGGKIEWRLANGRPFAVTVRFTYHSLDDDPKTPETGGVKLTKIGEVLFVKGLKGYEKIDFEVDAKTANVNVMARELADNAFLKGR